MSQYIPMLDYYCNSLPLISTAYASSECFFGINLNPLCKPSEVSYTLIPIVAYFEFLPIHRSNEVIDSISIPTPFNEKDEQQLVDLVDVKIGQEYELVVTAYSGNFQLPNEMLFFPCLLMFRFSWMYPFRTNNAPQFNFVCRENVILSIDSDKTNEIELQNAVKNVANNLMPFDTRVIDYTSYADTATIPEVTTNVNEVQKRVLHEILTRNANVEYLQRLNLNGHTDRETFKKFVPVITYEDIQPDINRIANGDTSPILCSQPISEFISSTGTSGGENKLIPTTEEELRRKSQFGGLVMSAVSQFFPDLEKGKGMYFMFIKAEAKTPGGLLTRTSLTSLYKSSHFRSSLSRVSPYTSPNEAILCLDSYQSMYSQMLCGLCNNKEVVCVSSLFASAFIRAMRFLEDHWSLLCNDIRTGTINNKITDPKVIEAVMKILKLDSELADFIEAECSKDSWQGIIPRLWPNTKYVDVVLTGAMSQYIPMLDYYCNSLPLISTTYASSECFFGINLNPLCKPSEVSYTLIPTMGYFEFLPIHRSNEFIDSISIPTPLNEKDEQQLVDLVDVKIGQEYELVVTTYSGLYRYRVGDVLRVAGYKNNVPQFNFIRRENVILSIDFDKTNEFDLQNAVNTAANNLIPFNAHVVDYTSYADITTIPGHYVLFWQLSANTSAPIPPSVLEDCCLTIEESLDSVYRQGRTSDKSIGPLEIRIVETSTLDKLMDYCCTRLLGASINQYKTPRCVKFAPLVELLNLRVVSSYFSPCLVPALDYFKFLPIHRSNKFIDSISIPTPLNEKDEQQLVDLVDVNNKFIDSISIAK
ncbi:hypothetical protein H5410_049579 [Solanum commersonii]|uniref:Indole-3-acetic acid-amido synthetase GH3.6 n=1 Tax=Solanum commersonii TaxID=4109 RepID=A0A9J5WVE8_SOLCO|nr:hypothetical protein H5410_049579 [Solanum commersonii]